MTARRRRHTVRAALVVLLVATLPSVAFALLWRWADGEAAPPATTTTTTTPAEPAAPLTTPLLSMRRSPGPLVDAAQARVDAAVLAPFAARIGPTSCLVATRAGAPIAVVNAELAVIPASNQKLLVAAVALDRLGPDHRFRTEVRAAAVNAGVVEGDLYVVGGGDPVLQTADYVGARAAPAGVATSLDALADAVVAAGITTITGDVVGDGTRYDDEFVVPSWGADIARVEAGPYDALVVDDGFLTGGSDDAGMNPNQSAASELNRLLRARGVTIGGRNRNGPTPPEATVVAAVESRPLVDLVGHLLQASDDDAAELLVKELGAVVAGAGTRVAGLDVVRTTLAGWGLPVESLVLDDGSGLSRANRATCELLVGVLDHVGRRSRMGLALPVAGRTGTLVSELVGTPAEGVLRAKTGTLSDVKALSGFTRSAGRDVTFALVLNEPGADDDPVYRDVWAGFADALAQRPERIDAARFGPR